MCTFLLVWLVLAYFVSSRRGWFGALLVLLVIVTLVVGGA